MGELRGKKLIWGARIALVLVALGMLVGKWHLSRSSEGFRVGEPSPRAFISVMEMEYFDAVATEALKSRVAERVSRVIVRDARLLKETFDRLEQLRDNEPALAALLPPGLLEMLAALPADARRLLLSRTREIGEGLLAEGAFGEERTNDIWLSVDRIPLSWSERNLAFQMLDFLLLRAERSDATLTALVQRSLSDSVLPVVRKLEIGDIIVEKGEVVTPEKGNILRSQGFPEETFQWKHALFVLVGTLLWSVWITELAEKEKLKRDPTQLMYAIAILAVAWSLELVTTYFHLDGMGALALSGWAFLAWESSYSFHFVLGGGALGVLLAGGASPSRLALALLIVGTLSGFGFFRFRRVSSRAYLWRELFLLGVFSSSLSLFAEWSGGGQVLPADFWHFAASSALIAGFVVATMPIWESIFDILSPLRLLELSHPSSPLLKRMQVEAPGTYHHTLMVGTLAEAAADRLGLNSLLVKAGAYYHDIGKLRRARFFVENQPFGVNVHDELAPTLSALIIISHVRDGCEIAGEARLPKQMRSFILEHHGTTCLSYFQRKSRMAGENAPREQFSYPGPRPASRETALVMLADSVEAAVRASGATGGRLPDLDDLVRGVIDTKVREEQLDNAEFTLRDLRVIREVFVETLRSMYHSRQVKQIAEKEPQAVEEEEA